MTRAVPLEEPCAGQLACTVLQTSGGSDPFAEFNHSKHSAVELHESEMNRAFHPIVTVSPWAVVLAPPVLLLALSYLCLAYAQSTILTWMPTYLIVARGVSIQEIGRIGIITGIASFVGLVSGGVLSDVLLRRGFTTRLARAQGLSLCIALATPFLVTAVLVSQASVTVACFTVYFFLTGMASGGYWTIPVELSPKHVGAISGVMVCAGALAGFFGPMFTPSPVLGTNINDSGATLFLVVAGITVVASLIFYFLVEPAPIEVTAMNKLVGGVVFALFGLFMFLWASRHSPYMGIGEMLTQGMEHYILKEPLYTLVLLFAAGLGLIGIALFVVGLVAQSRRS